MCLPDTIHYVWIQSPFCNLRIGDKQRNISLQDVIHNNWDPGWKPQIGSHVYRGWNSYQIRKITSYAFGGNACITFSRVSVLPLDKNMKCQWNTVYYASAIHPNYTTWLHICWHWNVGKDILRGDKAKWPPDDVFKWLFLVGTLEFRFKFRLSLILRYEITISQYWFR